MITYNVTGKLNKDTTSRLHGLELRASAYIALWCTYNITSINYANFKWLGKLIDALRSKFVLLLTFLFLSFSSSIVILWEYRRASKLAGFFEWNFKLKVHFLINSLRFQIWLFNEKTKTMKYFDERRNCKFVVSLLFLKKETLLWENIFLFSTGKLSAENRVLWAGHQEAIL